MTKEIKSVLTKYAGKTNDSVTRNNIIKDISEIVREKYDTFRIICDKSNNQKKSPFKTKLIADVYIKKRSGEEHNRYIVG